MLTIIKNVINCYQKEVVIKIHIFYIVILLNTLVILYTIYSFLEKFILKNEINQAKHYFKIFNLYNFESEFKTFKTNFSLRKNIKKIFKEILFKTLLIMVLDLIFMIFYYMFFKEFFEASEVIFPYSKSQIDIYKEYPEVWENIKLYFIYSSIISNLIIFTFIFINSLLKIKLKYAKIQYLLKNASKISKLKLNKKEEKLLKKEVDLINQKNLIKKTCELNLKLGFNEIGVLKLISQKDLYKNLLIVGSVGTGKTSACMYNITKQILDYNLKNINNKFGMLILDVKGNYYKFVEENVNKTKNKDDLILVKLDGEFKYNPLDKPELKPYVIANRLKEILLLFSPNNTESFWIDKAESLIAELIKFIRIYNFGYVTFTEIHKLITSDEYFIAKKFEVEKELKKELENNNLNHEKYYNYTTFKSYYEKEFKQLDQRTKGIILSEITRITSLFINDYAVNKTFCPKKKEITFKGFDELINSGKILVLCLNISEYKDLARIIASYLKLDFQTIVLSNLAKGNVKPTLFISDEYQEYVTKNDAYFYAQSREAMCINIVATQSYTSIKEKVKDDANTEVIIQNLVNKLWFRTDDEYTIEKAQKLIGKEEKEKLSKTIGENATNAQYSYISKKYKGNNKGVNESVNMYTNFEYIYDTKYFTRELKTFEALGFINNNGQIENIEKIKMIPYFITNTKDKKITDKIQKEKKKKI